ncbi:transglycosylase domain-containing protein [Caldalkalibacillus mannanilyticus]|uniref:transglycosylase domain-containing protein n=1 Tax=Caldalkalibacillus mannanilyticus TaxID=1418 RepID=UPI0006847F75|nr:penicillin-binding transpeptidase domain-containing protein [Caldalkalibacillus mannanilyticus]
MGGRDYVRKGTNRATSDARQPGSTFKPIAVYAPALESGWNPFDLVKDEKQSYGSYSPRNYDGKYRGDVTMMEAVQFSYNAPAVWLLNQIGIDKGVQYSKLFGFENPKRELGIALGDIGASPLKMANAYSAFANQGIQMEPYLIEKMIDRHGEHIGKKQINYEQVITPQSAWYMTKMLEKVVKEGTGKRAQFNHPVVGKTGTTQAPKGHKGVRDAWFVGYTPHYTAAVWMGFDQVKEGHVMDTSGGNHPAKVFKYVMEKAHEDKPVLSFEKPSGVEELQPPAKLDSIQDLSAFVTLYRDLSVSVDLEFTPSSDERVGYTISRTDLVSGEQKVLADKVTRDQLVNGRGWVDKDVQLMGQYQYQVTVVNLQTGQVGSSSNSVTVLVSPDSPHFRREDQVDNEEYNDWLNDLIDQFNRELDQEEVPEEEEQGSEEESTEPNGSQTGEESPPAEETSGSNEEDNP